jgi:hypothetical protein
VAAAIPEGAIVMPVHRHSPTRLTLGICSLAALLALTGPTGLAAAPGVLRAGAFAQDVTPPRFPITVNGNLRDGQAQGAADRLHARCLVLGNDDTALAIVIVDSCMIPRSLMDSAKTRAAYRTGIPADHILIAATHAHSCPTVTGVFQSEPDADYVAFLADRIVEGLERAWHQREPAKLGWGVVDNPTQLFNRRWKLKPGLLGENPFGEQRDLVRMNPGYSSPDVTESIGLIDPQVSLLAVQALDGRVIALLGNYSLHYVGGTPGNLLSADYFGEFATRIVRHVGALDQQPPAVGFLSNGTSADVNNVNFALKSGVPRQPMEQAILVAESVAASAAEAYRAVKYDEQPVLAVQSTEITLGVRKPTREELAAAREKLAEAGPEPYGTMPLIYARETVKLADYPDTLPVQIQALRLGDLAIVSSPCETFTETGLAVKAASPFAHTFTIELANGYNGYLPTPQQHAWGGYETWRARSSYLAVDAEPMLRNTQLDLLNRLKSP